MVLESVLVSFFYKWLTSFPDTTCNAEFKRKMKWYGGWWFSICRAQRHKALKKSSLSSMGGIGCWLFPWYFWRMNVLVRTVADQVEVANAWFSFPRHDSGHALYLFFPGVVQTRRARAVNLALSPLILNFRHTTHSVSLKTWTLFYRVLWCATINSKKSEKKIKGTSPVAQLVKKLPRVQEILVQFLGWEDPLEKGTATHSSILAWRIPWTV